MNAQARINAAADRRAGLCDQQIEALLARPNLTPDEVNIVLSLADLRDDYVARIACEAPDISEMTTQSGAPHYEVETYGDGTPGCISIDADAADDHRMPPDLANVILPLHRQAGETFRDAADRVWREHREATGQEKFGFYLGETVNVTVCKVGDKPGKVVGFADGISIQWPGNSGPSYGYRPEQLRHGP